MYDPDVFAVLIPHDFEARDSFRLNANAHFFHKAVKVVDEEPANSSRESTPAPPDSSQEPTSASQESHADSYNDVDRIILTFNKKPKDLQRGWQLGSTPLSSDVLLRGTRGVSRQHLYITINEKFMAEVHDNSSYGTAVGYDDEAKHEVRKKDKWILSFEPGRQPPWEEVIIYVPHAKALAFKIEFPNHTAGRPEYMANLQAFFEERRTALAPVSALGLNSNPTTVAPSQPRTPRQRPLYLMDRVIGQGEFGEVRRSISARDGDYYASKIFRIPLQNSNSSKKRKLDEENWLDKIRNEIEIMKENPHVGVMPSCQELGLIVQKPNIMQVIDFYEKPEPVLVMPYYPLGNLQDLKDVSLERYVSAFCQVLIGISHLHERGVVHRDLKPENFLVAAPFTIIIADFGLSKVATDRILTTFCGTHLYAAPEIYPGNSHGYGSSVDIWSTGVIFLGLIFTPPARPDLRRVAPEKKNKYWSQRWSEALVKRVNDVGDNDPLIAILIHMVRINPEERSTAEQCLDRGCSNGLFKRRPDGHIVVADDASEDGTITPTQQLHQSALGPGTVADNAPSAFTSLDRELLGSFGSARKKLPKSPIVSNQLTPIGDPNSG